jgi:NADPH:quinone reductase-like Zn-dependent oxidoreductase
MKSVRLHEIGGPQNLTIDDVPQPQPQPGEALVRIRAAALNHRDVYITQGLYPNIALPCILGADGAGEADGRAVLIDPTIGWGSDERVWSLDARILGVPRDGTFAEYVCVPKENVHAKPEHLSFEEAAALPLAGVTAFRATFTRGELRSGETLLVTGIGGGVQTFVLLYAKAAGARVIVTSSSDEKLERAKALGADLTVNYKTDTDWHKTLRKTAGAIDMIVDSAGGDTFAKATSIVRPGGRVVTYGGTSGDAKIRMFPVFWNQIDIRGSSMGSPADFRAMLEFVSKHRIKPVIDRVYAMNDVVAAAQRMSEAGQFGKIILTVSP